MSHARITFNLICTTDFYSLNTWIRHYAEGGDPCSDFCGNFVKTDTFAHENLPKALESMVVARDVEKGHCIAIKYGVDSHSLDFIENALVRFYGACGQPDSAFNLFETMSERNLVAWNSVLIGNVINRNFQWVARNIFWEVLQDGFKPDEFTLVSALTAAAHTGIKCIPDRVHGYMFRSGLEKNLHAANALNSSFLCKVWLSGNSRKLFAEMKEIRNVVSWDSMIVAASVNRFDNNTVELFEEFEREKLVPTEITFTGALFGCAHNGLAEKAFAYFERMTKKYGIEPVIEHYACMAQLLCIECRWKEAFEFIQKMPLKPNRIIWRMLYDTCPSVVKYRPILEVADQELEKLEGRSS